MIYKQEAIDVLEVYRRNVEHILGDENELVKVIQTCIDLVSEIEDTGWTPVSERLPDNHTRVVVWMAWNGFGMLDFEHNHFYPLNSVNEIPTEAVIAWMPLPKPYKEEKNERSEEEIL